MAKLCLLRMIARKISESIKDLKLLYNSKKNNIRFKQVIVLYGVNFIGIPIGIVTSIIVTRFLGPKVYGDYRFLISLFTLASLFFSFGFFQAGNRALVLNDDRKKASELFGAELIITLGLFLVMTVFLTAYGIFDTNLKEKGISIFFMYLIPFSWIFLLIKYFEVLFQADNRINLLAATRLWPKVGFFLSTLIIFFVFFNFNGNKHALVWFFFLLTQAVIFIIVLISIKPSFKNLKNRVSEIWHFNKKFGLQVYIGSIFAVGFAQLTSILISYFGFDNAGVGYYNLALTFSMPLTLIPNVIATTHYKDFSTQIKIPDRLFKVTLFLSFASLVFVWIIVGPFIRFFYGSDFEPVILLTIIISTGSWLHGLADFFNRFLGAHGRGKALRNSSFIVGISLLAFSLILIPFLGEKGAAITKVTTGIIYVICIYIYYYILVRKLKNNSI